MLKAWFTAIRPKTLPASVSPVLLGAALAFHEGEFKIVIFALTLICAVLLQISVNLANDLFDARSGVDTSERLGPIRVVQSELVSEKQLIAILGFTIAIAGATGLLLVYLSSWILLIFGTLSVLVVFSYSAGPWPLASHAMGEVTVFLFFGLLAVGGSYFVHTQEVNIWAMVFGAAAGLMSAAIMLVNNIRDIQTDSAALKNTLAVRLGDNRARTLYKLLLFAAVLIHLPTVFVFDWYSLIPIVVCIPLGIKLVEGITSRKGRELNTQLAQTAKLEWMYCSSMSGILILLSGFQGL